MGKASEFLWRHKADFPERTEWETEVRVSTQATNYAGSLKWVHRLFVRRMFIPSPARGRIPRSINKELIFVQSKCDDFEKTIAPRDLNEDDHNLIVGLATVIPLTLPFLPSSWVDKSHVQKSQGVDENGSVKTRLITREKSNDNRHTRYTIHHQVINGDVVLHNNQGIVRSSRNQTGTVQVMFTAEASVAEITSQSEYIFDAGRGTSPVLEKDSKSLVSLIRFTSFPAAARLFYELFVQLIGTFCRSRRENLAWASIFQHRLSHGLFLLIIYPGIQWFSLDCTCTADPT